MIKKGKQFICIQGNTFFEKGHIYEIVYIDNEKPIIEVHLKSDNKNLVIDIETFRKKFEFYDKK